MKINNKITKRFPMTYYLIIMICSAIVIQADELDPFAVNEDLSSTNKKGIDVMIRSVLEDNRASSEPPEIAHISKWHRKIRAKCISNLKDGSNQQKANAARLIVIFRFEGAIERLLDNLSLRYRFFNPGEPDGTDLENLPCAFALLQLNPNKVKHALDVRERKKPWNSQEKHIVKIIREKLSGEKSKIQDK